MDNSENVIVYVPNPIDVEWRLKEAHWTYRNSASREDDFAYNGVAVIPRLFSYVAHQRQIPSLPDVTKHLWGLRNVEAIKGKDQNIAYERTKKLVQDFFRELHTFGLLARSDYFGNVRYAKGEDIFLNVDYTAIPSMAIVASPEDIGIQASMRKNWAEDQFTSLKSRRAFTRQHDKVFDGPIYWLTNRYRPPLQAGGCWLFTIAHINELIEEIRGNKSEGDLGVNTFIE